MKVKNVDVSNLKKLQQHIKLVSLPIVLAASISMSANTVNAFGTIDDSTKITISESEYDKFEESLQEYGDVFKYSDLYDVEKALKEDQKVIKPIKKHTHSIKLENNKFSSDEIAKVIKENSKEYLKGDEITPLKRASFKTLDNKKTKEVSKIIADVLNAEIKNNKNIDIEELKCVIGDLKVYTNPTTANAYVDEKGCLVMSPNMIKLTKIIKKTDDAEQKVIVHEIEHLIQKSCRDHKVLQFGVSKNIDTLEVNPLEWKWAVEASAEKKMMEYTDSEPLTYDYIVSYLNTVGLSGMLYGKNSENIEDAFGQKDRNELFKMFNCSTKEDQKELINLMYTIDIMQYNREDILNKIGNVDGTRNFQESLKPSIGTICTKHFYRSLGNYVRENNVTLEDMMFLIRVFESDMSVHINCSNNEYKRYKKEYLNNYCEIRDDFFESISNNNVTFNQIFDKYNSYELGSIPKNIEKKCTKDQIEFINDRIAYAEDRGNIKHNNEYYKNKLNNKKTY